MDQRVAFVADWLRNEWTMTELATRYAISRKTAYKWIDRYTADPVTGLVEQSRAPHAPGRARPETLREAVLALRRRHPSWGSTKLRAILQERDGAQAWPAASTMGEWLRRAGLSEPRRRVRYVVPLSQPLAAAGAERRVVCGFQRVVSDRRRHTVRSADGDGRVQSVCPVLSDYGAESAGGAAVVRTDLSRLRVAVGPADR